MKFFEKMFLALIAVFLCVTPLFSQAPDTLWTRVYGGAHDDCIYDVIETSNSEYVAVGWTRSFGAGNSDVYLLKLDVNGDTIWTKTYGGPLDDEGRSVQETADKGFIIAGNTGLNIYLLKTDPSGNILWSEWYGGSNYDYGYSVQETPDKGYIIAGRISSFSVGGFDVFLTKMDSLGNTLWSKIYGGTGWDAGCSIRKTSDGGFLIAGMTTSNGADWDVYFMKTDANGDSLWTKTSGGVDWDVGYEVQETFDGGFIIAGCTDSYGAGGFDMYLVKIDSLGNIGWTRTQGGTGWDEGQSVQETPDKGFIIAGSTESYGVGGFDVYLVRTYSNGYPIWTKTYGGANWDIAYSVKLTSDGGYIIAGKTKSFGAGLYDVYLIKTKPDLGTEEKKDPRQKARDIKLSAQPNPFTEKTVIRYSSLAINDQLPMTNDLQYPTLRIYDVSGRLIRSFPSSLLSLCSSVSWDGKDNKGEFVSPGVYFVEMKVGNKEVKEKIIYVK